MTITDSHPTRFLFAGIVVLAVSWAQYGQANAPPGRYTIANGIVTDTKTLLTWQQTISTNKYDQIGAQSYCSGLNLNGTGWRVPSMKELQTIVDENRIGPATDLTAFPSAPDFYYWTSSPLAGSPSYAWFVDFFGGNPKYAAYTSAFLVRCVR